MNSFKVKNCIGKKFLEYFEHLCCKQVICVLHCGIVHLAMERGRGGEYCGATLSWEYQAGIM